MVTCLDARKMRESIVAAIKSSLFVAVLLPVESAKCNLLVRKLATSDVLHSSNRRSGDDADSWIAIGAGGGVGLLLIVLMIWRTHVRRQELKALPAAPTTAPTTGKQRLDQLTEEGRRSSLALITRAGSATTCVSPEMPLPFPTSPRTQAEEVRRTSLVLLSRPEAVTYLSPAMPLPFATTPRGEISPVTPCQLPPLPGSTEPSGGWDVCVMEAQQ
mmetsp:Transcript_60137/g.141563  ORF Transcript_60137/g.141563 Transcript_60137/m.141563 type:complete len:216 (+) Transcript_60137:95-742(+)